MRYAFGLRLVVAVAALTCAVEAATLTDIDHSKDRGFDYLNIYTEGDVQAKGMLLEKQLTITFSGCKENDKFKIYRRPSKRIKDITVNKTGSDEIQVVIELKKDIDYEIVNVFGRGKTVVEICDRIDITAQLFAAWEKQSLKEKGETIKPQKYLPVAAADRYLRGKTIILDPGHGGKDPGAMTSKGIPEKVLTLNTAKIAARLLSSAGATVYLTRGEDRTCNLQDIVAFANKSGADIYISIHYNFNGDRDIAGTETYYYNLDSRRLALSVHAALIDGLRRKDRGLRRVMFYTVHHTQMPAALLEPVYLSNEKEEDLALSLSFQEDVARSILQGVKTYF